MKLINPGGGGVQNLVYIGSKSDFPPAASGVITLTAGKTYLVTTAVDLEGDRLETSGVCNLLGLSSEISSVTSTGLGVGIPLVTSAWTLVIENITIKDVDTAVSINGTTRLVALDWENLNFQNVPSVGTINTCDNFIFDTAAFLSSKGLILTGTIGTVAINNTLLSGDGAAGNIVELDASCIITRRFRVIYTSVVAFGSTVGINVNASATIPTESYILDTVNFAGGGTYISGVDASSNDALFINCKDITNSAANGQLYMQNNAVATTVSLTDTFYKIAGTTTASTDNSKFSHSNNRLTCDAVINRKYLIQCSLSFTASNGNVCEFGFYDSQLAAVRAPSRIKSTANAAGRAEGVTFFCVVVMDETDYLEIHCANTSATTNITVDQMNFTITEIR